MSKKKKLFTTKAIVMLGLLMAMSIILERIPPLSFYITDNIRVAFGNLPIIIAGLLFGPIAGGLVGLFADFLGWTMFPQFTYFFPLALTPVLMGVVPPLVGMLLKKRNRLLTFIAMILPAEILGPILWSNIALQWLNGVPFFVNLPMRAPIKAAIAVVDILLIFLLYKSGLFRTLGVDIYGGKKHELRRNAQVHPQREVAGE